MLDYILYFILFSLGLLVKSPPRQPTGTPPRTPTRTPTRQPTGDQPAQPTPGPAPTPSPRALSDAERGRALGIALQTLPEGQQEAVQQIVALLLAPEKVRKRAMRYDLFCEFVVGMVIMTNEMLTAQTNFINAEHGPGGDPHAHDDQIVKSLQGFIADELKVIARYGYAFPQHQPIVREQPPLTRVRRKTIPTTKYPRPFGVGRI